MFLNHICLNLPRGPSASDCRILEGRDPSSPAHRFVSNKNIRFDLHGAFPNQNTKSLKTPGKMLYMYIRVFSGPYFLGT